MMKGDYRTKEVPLDEPLVLMMLRQHICRNRYKNFGLSVEPSLISAETGKDHALKAVPKSIEEFLHSGYALFMDNFT